MNESIGAKLRQAREQRGLTLQQVSETTKVRAHYLQALENDDVSAIPSAAQARGFMRIYADFLSLNLADLVPVAGSANAAPASEPAPRSTSDLATAAGQQGNSTSEPSRPSLLGRLRARFVRLGDHGTADSLQIEATTPSGSERTIEVPAPKKRTGESTRSSLPESSETPVPDQKTKAPEEPNAGRRKSSKANQQNDVKKNASG